LTKQIPSPIFSLLTVWAKKEGDNIEKTNIKRQINLFII
jgi:hypothetical protein